MHWCGGDHCTIKITANGVVKGWVSIHLPIGVEIVEHNGNLEIENDEIETGMKTHRFLFEDTTNLTIGYTTSEPVDNENYYWAAWQPGNPMFGYVDGDLVFSTN